MSNFILVRTYLSESEALVTLKEFDKYFYPCLSSRLNIEEFAHKLSQNAKWILCKVCNRIIGYIAYYTNFDTGIIHMSSYCQIPSNNDVLKRMVNCLIDTIPSGIHEIEFRCRKDNEIDIEFYQQFGFSEREDLGEHIIMSKLITDLKI